MSAVITIWVSLTKCQTINHLHHALQWLAAMTHHWLYQLPMVGVDKYTISAWAKHYAICVLNFSHISKSVWNTHSWCWLALKKHQSCGNDMPTNCGWTSGHHLSSCIEWHSRTHPLHLEHNTFLDNDSFFDVPLYKSSRETFKGWTTSSPLLCLRLPLPLPPANKSNDNCKMVINIAMQSQNKDYKKSLLIHLIVLPSTRDQWAKFAHSQAWHTSKRLSTTSKEGLKDIKWIVWGTTTPHSFLESIFTILVVQIPFLRVT